ncbi:MAG TPA: single-stranded DNA-binding protein [Anaerolineae bacterium]|nr:single-stranded DNA-binding protein [Anaerolineae bacterium]HID84833.1 single-stranded DNA-binding protein [Anaerolineales bacterium]
MPSLNRVQLIGRLGRAPERRFTPSGKPYAIFSLAVDRRWRSPQGELRQTTDWFTIEAYGRLGEICEQYLSKGRLVYIEGRLRVYTVEGEGQRRRVVRIVARDMQMLDRPPEEEPAELAEEEEPLEETPPPEDAAETA